MTDTEKPLYVRVAEALGCKTLPLEDGPNDPLWWCDCAEECPATGYITGGRVRHYDTDWSATGPLIEKYEISLDYEQLSGVKASAWRHVPSDLPEDQQYGGRWIEFSKSSEKSLIAVCNLILALHVAGHLE